MYVGLHIFSFIHIITESLSWKIVKTGYYLNRPSSRKGSMDHLLYELNHYICHIRFEYYRFSVNFNKSFGRNRLETKRSAETNKTLDDGKIP